MIINGEFANVNVRSLMIKAQYAPEGIGVTAQKNFKVMCLKAWYSKHY